MKESKELVGAGVAALTLIGGIIFGAQRIAYERFYDQFGLAPEDVGADVTRVLSQTAGGVAVWLIIGTVYVTGVLFLVARGIAHVDAKVAVRVGLVVSVVATGLLFFRNVADADDAARCAKRLDGQPVRGFRLSLPGAEITRLGVRADRAVVRDTDPKANPPWDGRQVVFLGTAQGTTIVYDPRQERTLRLPAQSVEVSIDTTTERFHPRSGECQRVGR